MRNTMVLGLAITMAGVLACSDSQSPGGGGGSPVALLKDVNVTSLPSPYYHFEYGSGGQITRVAFASDFLSYNVVYQVGRITELHDSTAGNRDRLQYVYDLAGRVARVDYIDPTNTIFARVTLTYDGDRLIRLDRERTLAGAMTLNKTMTFSYGADGNLEEIVDHRPEISGQQAASTTIDRFEQYDDGVNVEAFGLIHNDFFDHVVLLPDVRLQRGNPAREFFTGGGVDYRFDFTYTYDAQQRPVLKTGTATILTGPDSGQVTPLSTAYSYY